MLAPKFVVVDVCPHLGRKVSPDFKITVRRKPTLLSKLLKGEKEELLELYGHGYKLTDNPTDLNAKYALSLEDRQKIWKQAERFTLFT